MISTLNEADEKETNLFQHKYCKNTTTLAMIARDFRLEAEAYLDLPIGCSIYSTIRGGQLTQDAVVVVKAIDDEKHVFHYIVLPEAMGKRFLREWNLTLPHKMSALAETKECGSKMKGECNICMRHLLEYLRWFMLTQRRVYKPFPDGLQNIYNQLHEKPRQKVSVDDLKTVNRALYEILNDETECRCENLQDYAEYLRNRYTILEFKKSDFSSLRNLLKEIYPNEVCYF